MRKLLVLAGLVLATPIAAQQASSSRDVRQAYGSPIDRQALPIVGRGATSRLPTRINNRINNRLNLRVQRYNFTPTDPTAAYRSSQDDRSRVAPAVDPLPTVPQ